MRQTTAILIIALLISCRKNTYEYDGEGKYFIYTCTLRPNTGYDTIPDMNPERNQYSILGGKYNEVNETRSISFLMNGQIVRQFRIVESYRENEFTFGDRTDIYLVLDSHGLGYKSAVMIRDNQLYPNLDRAYETIIDFPFPGWNRFMLEE